MNRYRFTQDIIDRTQRDYLADSVGKLCIDTNGEIVKIVHFSEEGWYTAECPNGTWGGQKITVADFKKHWQIISEEAAKHIIEHRQKMNLDKSNGEMVEESIFRKTYRGVFNILWYIVHPQVWRDHHTISDIFGDTVR